MTKRSAKPHEVGSKANPPAKASQERVAPPEDRTPPPEDKSKLDLPPHSVETEEILLGAVLMNPEGLHEVAAFLTTEDFFIVRHGWVWEAFLRLQARNDPIDNRTVAEELRVQDDPTGKHANRLEAIGGEAFLNYLPGNVPTALHAEVYGRIVERAALRRRLLGAAGEISQLAYDEDRDLNKVIADAEKALFDVTTRRLQQEIVPLRVAAGDYYERVAKLREADCPLVGVPTGFRELDALTGGLHAGDLTLVAGRPGSGKTSFLLTLALHAARQGQAKVAIFSLEMGNDQLVQRMVSVDAGLNSQRLRNGTLDDEEWGRFVVSVAHLSDLNIHLDDSPSLTPAQLRSKCLRLQREYGLDLVLLDYVQLMHAPGYDGSEVRELTYISRAVKELARELSVPLVAAAQLNRSLEGRHDKQPQLSDLRGSGCLTGDSLVALADGRRVPIGKLCGQAGFDVWALNEQTMKLERATVSNAFCSGVKPVYRMTTALGRSIHATGNHKFLTIHGWKRLDELQAGEHIAVPRGIPSPTEQTMPNAELALLGHLIGDGCTLPRHALQYTTPAYDLAELVAGAAEEIFGDAVAPRIHQERGRNWYQVFIPTTRHITHGVRNPVSEWLDALDVFGLRSYEKHVPGCVFQQPVEAIALFLRHLWATDGHIGLRQSRGRPCPNVYYATSSQRLAEDVQTLLLRLGINARVNRVPQQGKGRDQYHVIVSGNEDLRAFVTRIGPTCRSDRERAAAISTYLTEHPGNTNRDIIPHSIWRLDVVPAMQRQKITCRQMWAEMGMSYAGTSVYKQNVSRERLLRVAEVVRSEKLVCLSRSDVYWDSIRSIEPAGEAEVFDLTVPALSNFVAENYIVHNSLEQDSDMVWFLYRDELYNEATERPGEADVIIAKQRNGPIGVVPLFFQKDYTRFTNLYRQQINLNTGVVTRDAQWMTLSNPDIDAAR